jgi:hypothetical protein
MNVSRLTSLVAALVITAIEWAAFSSVPLHAQAVRAAAAPVASDALDPELPVIVITAHRQS